MSTEWIDTGFFSRKALLSKKLVFITIFTLDFLTHFRTTFCYYDESNLDEIL